MAPAKPGGVGAKGSAVMKLFHPSEPLRARFGSEYDNKGRLCNCTIVRKSFGRASRRGRETHLYHVTHDDFPGQEFLVAKHSFKVEVGCTNPDNIFEDEHPPSAPEASLPQEDPNLSLRESRSNNKPSVQILTRQGLSTSAWQNQESRELQLMMTTSLSQRTLELNLFLLLLELGLMALH